jgi:hypothetical protein
MESSFPFGDLSPEAGVVPVRSADAATDTTASSYPPQVLVVPAPTPEPGFHLAEPPATIYGSVEPAWPPPRHEPGLSWALSPDALLFGLCFILLSAWHRLRLLARGPPTA